MIRELVESGRYGSGGSRVQMPGLVLERESLRRLDQGRTMEDIDLAYAKNHLEELIHRAHHGEEVRIITPKGERVRLEAVKQATRDLERRERVPGRWKGRLAIPPGLFNPMSEEELRLWYGETV